MSKRTVVMSTPSCAAIPSVSIAISGTLPQFEYSSHLIINAFYKDNELYFENSADITVKDYPNNITKNFVKNDINKKNDFFGFNLVIPAFNVELPSFAIPKYPTINNGCNECESPYLPPVCDWKTLYYKKCTRIITRKVCVSVPYYAPTKCLNELVFIDKTFPSVKLFDFKETKLEFSFQLIPNIEIDSITKVGITTGATVVIGTDPKINVGTHFVSLDINKFKFGLKIKIKTLKFYYGDTGFVINNLTIPLIPQYDILAGEKTLTIKADSSGNLTLWYLIKTYQVTLYDILNTLIPINSDNDEPSSVNGNPPNKGNNLLNDIISKSGDLVINFLKQTYLDIGFGLLICPLPKPNEDVFLSFVTQANISLEPFSQLNTIEIPTIPTQYSKIPSIPNNNIIPKEIVDLINNVNKNALSPVTSLAEKEVVNSVNYIKTVIEAVKIKLSVQLPIPIIFKNIPIVPVA